MDNSSAGPGESDRHPRNLKFRKASLWAAGTVLAAIIGSVIGYIVTNYAPGVEQAVRGNSPLRVTVGYPNAPGWKMVTSGRYTPAGFKPAKDSCQHAGQFVRDHGADDLTNTKARIALEGLNRETILVTGIRADVISRGPAPSGAIISCPNAGFEQAAGLGFNLNQDNPVALTIKKVGSNYVGLEIPTFGHPYFQNSYLTISKGEVVALDVFAHVNSGECTWRIALDAVIAGERRTLYVQPPQGPFKTTSPVRHYGQHWTYRWDLRPERFLQEP